MFPCIFQYLEYILLCFGSWYVGYMRYDPAWIAVGFIPFLMMEIFRKRRVKKINALKSITKDEKAFIHTKLSVKDLPSWVFFPDTERAEWVNRMIARMWPNVCDYGKEVLVNSIAPDISRRLPSILAPFRFVDIDLGDTPPRIAGVKVYADEGIKKDEIIMDIDLMLYSDAVIKIQVARIVTGIKDFELRGKLRLTLKPLIPRIPFFGAVILTFLDTPRITFDLTNLIVLPGTQQILYKVLRDVVNHLLVVPNRIPIQLVDDIYIEQLKYPMPQGLLRIHIIQGSKLEVSDTDICGRGSSDPYCIVNVGARSFQTRVIKGTLFPLWDEMFEALVDIYRGQSVQVEVYDKDRTSRDDYLGSFSLPISEVHAHGELDKWVALEGVKTGWVHLKLTWFDFSHNPSDFQQALEDASDYRQMTNEDVHSGLLYVVVEQAANLMFVKQRIEPSPCCTLTLGRDTQLTSTRERTTNPKWNSVHYFLVNDPHLEVLKITVLDRRTDKELGYCTVSVKDMLLEDSMYIARPFFLRDAGSGDATLHLRVQLFAFLRCLNRADGKFSPPSSVNSNLSRSEPNMLTALKKGHVAEQLFSPISNLASRIWARKEQKSKDAVAVPCCEADPKGTIKSCASDTDLMKVDSVDASVQEHWRSRSLLCGCKRMLRC